MSRTRLRRCAGGSGTVRRRERQGIVSRERRAGGTVQLAQLASTDDPII